MPPAKTAPNLFELRGKDLQIVYSTTSITGKPRLQLQGKPRSRSFTGSEIRSQETEIGTLVTVTLEQVPDLHTITLTVLLPEISPPAGPAIVAFKTTALRTTHHTSIGGPALVKGPLQTYEMIPLDGKARSVRF